MVKRSAKAEKKVTKIQLAANVIKSKKKEKKSTSKKAVPSQRVTRSAKTVNLDLPRVSISSKNPEASNGTGEELVGDRKYFTRSSKVIEIESSNAGTAGFEHTVGNIKYLTRSTKISEKSSKSDEIKSSSSSAASYEHTEKRIQKRADFVRLEKFETNTVCLAKQKYSCPWPARVVRVEKEKILVHFFGDKRVGYVQKGEIYDFMKSSQAIRSILNSKKKPSGFITGLAEIEQLLQIDSAHSLMNAQVSENESYLILE